MVKRQLQVKECTSESESSSTMTAKQREYESVIRGWYEEAGNGKRLRELAQALMWGVSVIVAGSGEGVMRDMLATFRSQVRFLKERMHK